MENIWRARFFINNRFTTHKNTKLSREFLINNFFSKMIDSQCVKNTNIIFYNNENFQIIFENSFVFFLKKKIDSLCIKVQKPIFYRNGKVKNE